MSPARARGPRREWADRERSLLDELEKLILAEGFTSLRLEDIVARLNVSRSTLYRLAPSKQALVEFVIDRMFRHMGKRAREAVEAADGPARRVAAYLGAGTATVRAGSLAFSRDLEANAETRAIYDRHQAIGMKTLAELIDDGVRDGQFRQVPAAFVMQVTDAAHARLRDPAVLEGLGMSHAEAIDGLIAILLEGIAGDGSARPPPRPQVLLSGAVELALGRAVREAGPLLRREHEDRASGVLGVPDASPTCHLRDFNASIGGCSWWPWSTVPGPVRPGWGRAGAGGSWLHLLGDFSDQRQRLIGAGGAGEDVVHDRLASAKVLAALQVQVTRVALDVDDGAGSSLELEDGQ
jgi:AcrR family transcriptional regulator